MLAQKKFYSFVILFFLKFIFINKLIINNAIFKIKKPIFYFFLNNNTFYMHNNKTMPKLFNLVYYLIVRKTN